MDSYGRGEHYDKKPREYYPPARHHRGYPPPARRDYQTSYQRRSPERYPPLQQPIKRFNNSTRGNYNPGPGPYTQS